MFGNATSGPRIGAMEAFARGVPAELATFVKQTYALLAFALALGAAACWGMMQVMPLATVHLKSGAAVQVPALSPLVYWGLVLGGFVFMFVGSLARAGARQGEVPVQGLVGLLGMVVCIGASLGPVIGTYVGLGMASTVAAAAVITAVTFSALTAFVLVTGTRFGFLGKFLFVALIGLLVAQVAGAFFFRGTAFHTWVAGFGAVIFCGYILFDTSRLVHTYGPRNLVVPAVIELFLDIVNLFLFILQILGSRREGRS